MTIMAIGLMLITIGLIVLLWPDGKENQTNQELTIMIVWVIAFKI